MLEGDPNRALTHERLYVLGIVAFLDPQGSAGAAQGVQAVFCDGTARASGPR